jgi:hypothetical protein
LWILGLVLIAAGAGYFVTQSARARLPAAAPRPSTGQSFSVAVLGDAPYFAWEQGKYQRILREIDAQDLSFVVHVGDILWKPCDDGQYGRTRQEFEALRHPVIYTPGDNEWTDCWEGDAGGFDPLERLKRLREIFFRDPEQSLGRRRIAVVSQRARPGLEDFVENRRWTHNRVVFATAHVVGSGNGTEDARGPAETQEARRRIEAAAAWVRETFADAIATDAAAVVIAIHANPFFEERRSARRRPYDPFVTAVEEEAARFARPVLIAHGDHHVYVVDQPVTRSTGDRLDRVTRLQVPGSPLIGWVRITVTPDSTSPFTFEPHTIPVWQYW